MRKVFAALCLGSWLGCLSVEAPPLEHRLDAQAWAIHALNDTLGLGPIPGTVPGYVLQSLTDAGITPHPYLGTNERRVQWVEHVAWNYVTALELPAGWSERDSVFLRFEGLDTYAHVLLDGDTLMSTDNAHRPWTSRAFVLGDTPRELAVQFDPVAQRGLAKLQAHPLPVPASNEALPIGQQTSPFTRKPSYQFGWDWGPRLAGPGIHGSVHLVRVPARGSRTLALPECRVVEVTESLATLDAAHAEDWELRIALDGQAVPHTRTNGRVEIPNPERWWPRPYGEQPLYDFVWTHTTSGNTHRQRLGLRSLEWDQTPDAMGTSFQLRVNDVPIYVRGSNVVPPDFHDAHSGLGWERLLDHALDANMNMLRVWGGGVYPPTSFFERCDEHGVLVWQDFMFACAMVPTDEGFLRNVESEARHHVRRLRNHACLALWCGNNEVERAWESWGWQGMYGIHGEDSVALRAAYDRVFREALPRVVKEESDATYLPSSPTLEADAGDEHAWGIWFGKESWDYYSHHPGRFVSEYGLQSLPNMHTLLEAGITRFDDEALQFRQRCTMDWLEPGFDGWDMMLHCMTQTVGPPAPGSLGDWVFRSQVTQAEGLRQALERHRTSQGRYAGSLYWSLNDVWPAVSWSTVDHAGRWKLAHHAAQRANGANVALWHRARNDSVVFSLVNDTNLPWSTTVDVWVDDFWGTRQRGASRVVEIPAHSTVTWAVGTMPDWRRDPTTTSLNWTVQLPGGRESRQSALWVPPVQAKLPPAAIATRRVAGGWELSSDVYVPVCALHATEPGHFGNNGMPLHPGDTLFVSFASETGETGQLTVWHLQSEGRQ